MCLSTWLHVDSSMVVAADLVVRHLHLMSCRNNISSSLGLDTVFHAKSEFIWWLVWYRTLWQIILLIDHPVVVAITSSTHQCWCVVSASKIRNTV